MLLDMLAFRQAALFLKQLEVAPPDNLVSSETFHPPLTSRLLLCHSLICLSLCVSLSGPTGWLIDVSPPPLTFEEYYIAHSN